MSWKRESLRRIALGLAAALLGTAPAAATPEQDMALIRARMLEPSMTPVSSATVDQYLATLRADGSWPDVDYADPSSGNWLAVRHLGRVRLLARALVAPGSPFLDDDALADAAMRSLDYWLDEDLTNVNWWWNEIGVPSSLVTTLLLLDDRLTEAQRDQGGRIVARARIRRTGANLVDMAFITLGRALLQRDAELATRAVTSMADQIRITTDEGIQPDWSFHQHGPLLYNHGYGAEFMKDQADLAAFVTGTGFALAPERIERLNGLILDGTAWMTRFDTKDYGATGRGIARRSGSGGSARYLRDIVSQMRMVETGREADYARFAAHLDGGPPPFTGNRSFYRSDFMAHQRDGWYASARMFSDRLRNTDTPYNDEGLRSHHVGDGGTWILRDGREYHDIFPVWDWWKVPGTTVALTPELSGKVGRMGSRPFAGGASDGRYGVAGFDFERDGLRARKAWFFFDDEMVALGAGIASSSPYEVVTTVNQCFLRGVVTHGADTGARPLGRGTHALGGRDWLHHDGVTYVVPAAADARLTADAATGSWHRINGQLSADPVTHDTFTLWLRHGVRPAAGTYQYIAAPGIDLPSAPAYAAGLPVRVLANTDTLQAVAHTGVGIAGAVFYRPGSVDLPSGLRVTVDAPCALLVRADTSGATVTASSPAHQELRLSVDISGAWVGEAAVELPGGDTAGASVTARVARDPGTAVVGDRGTAAVPAARVEPNAPNPFNGETLIRYALPEPAQVRLEVYTLTGQRLAVLARGPREAGHHQVRWDGRDVSGAPLASGVYLCRLTTASTRQTQKLMLVR